MNINSGYVFNVVISDLMVLADHPNTVLGSQGGAQRDGVIV